MLSRFMPWEEKFFEQFFVSAICCPMLHKHLGF